jgi:hypothetical protein
VNWLVLTARNPEVPTSPLDIFPVSPSVFSIHSLSMVKFQITRKVNYDPAWLLKEV